MRSGICILKDLTIKMSYRKKGGAKIEMSLKTIENHHQMGEQIGGSIFRYSEVENDKVEF